MSFLIFIVTLAAFASAFLFTAKISVGLAATVVLSSVAICMSVYGAAEMVVNAIRAAHPTPKETHLT